MPHCKLQVPAQELHDFDLRAPGLAVDAPSPFQWHPAVIRRFDPRTLAAAARDRGARAHPLVAGLNMADDKKTPEATTPDLTDADIDKMDETKLTKLKELLAQPAPEPLMHRASPLKPLRASPTSPALH